MKIGVISDTHIPTHANHLPAKVLDSLKTMDMILHAGDLVELNVLGELKSICNNVKAVCGNMDTIQVRDVLPKKEVIVIGKHKIGLTHGRGSATHIIESVTETFRTDGVDIIVFGHSHHALNEKIESILYFNPGSLTDTVFAPFNSYGILEINDQVQARIVKF